jgi:transposase-like protein
VTGPAAGHGRTKSVTCGDLQADGRMEGRIYAMAEARSVGYAWADGVYPRARMEEHRECMLVLLGATPESKKELIGFRGGMRENAQSWRELLVDLKSRELSIAPEVAAGDSKLGFCEGRMI